MNYPTTTPNTPSNQVDGGPTHHPVDGVERRAPDSPPTPRQEFVWQSTTGKKLWSQIDRISSVSSTLLLQGESGTGKSTIARLVHERSNRRGKPFISVDCSSFPRDLIDAELFGHAKGAFTGAIQTRMGRVEMADGGTLFLDEIGDLPLELQPKLLTFLQERSFYRLGSNVLRHVDVRVISATHTDLLLLASENRFRRDLFFRLAVLRLVVPTLAERRGEIRIIAERILSRICRSQGIKRAELCDATVETLESYNWPGNIRELENVLESAMAFQDTGVIRPEDLCLIGNISAPRAPIGDASFLNGKSLKQIEKEAIIAALKQNGGNKSQTARSLGISLRSVYNKMRKHGIVIEKSLNATDEFDHDLRK